MDAMAASPASRTDAGGGGAAARACTALARYGAARFPQVRMMTFEETKQPALCGHAIQFC
ncbi:hypothetical protein WS67_02480 [Burkholderia singularis]|uniref:Uncharacterized protein n=1 Tax=Burkholderia singularis TaxID=1503053 RepID=A0A118DLJ7_9BURK|nr:hypothetical protein WS67_02480 [Burkholderia singularis]